MVKSRYALTSFAADVVGSMSVNVKADLHRKGNSTLLLITVVIANLYSATSDKENDVYLNVETCPQSKIVV